MSKRYAPGTTWLYKGNTYEILCESKISGGTKDFSAYVYKRVGDADKGKLFVRLKDDFQAKFMRCEGISDPKEPY